MSTRVNISPILNAVRKAGDLFLNDFKQHEIPLSKEELLRQLQIIDSRCKKGLEEALRLVYQDVPFYLGDEFDSNGLTKPLELPEYWLCDAMDGAIQYLQHLVGWTINLVLIRNGETVFSVIYDPLSNEMFYAELGYGAYMNGQLIKTKFKKDPDGMIAVFNYGHQGLYSDESNIKHGEAVTQLLNNFGIVRNYGPHGLQLAYIGAGRIDLFYQVGLDTYNWLAGILIAKEAGAEVLNNKGRTWGWGDDSLVVSAKGVAEILIKAIASETETIQSQI